MWSQPSPPDTDRWMLHIAATPHEVDELLADLYIHKRARPTGDPGFPACLTGWETPAEPPAWMRFAQAELERRGYRTRWCDPDCPYHRWPPRPEPPGESSVRPRRQSGASLQRLLNRAPHAAVRQR
jgi:hypothetical protein